MAKPILFSVNAFDKSNAHDFPFSYQGNQAFKNKLTIYNSTTNEVVYSQEQITMQLQHTLPADTLQNGVCYTAEIAVYDRDGNASPTSDKIIFYCFSFPSFSFSNLIANQIVGNSNYELQLSYSQAEEEPLVTFQVNIYDYAQALFYQSGVIYDTVNLKTYISGLQDNGFYYAQATGITLNGMLVDTGKVPFSVDYMQPSAWAMAQLENIPTQGVVKIASNIVVITGTSNPDPPIYIDNKMVDLRQDGSWVKFDEGFQIENDFTLQVIGRDFQNGQPILELSNGEYKVEVIYRIAQFNGFNAPTAYLELSAYNSYLKYFLTSNYIDVPENTEYLYFWIRRINNIYEIKLKNKGA